MFRLNNKKKDKKKILKLPSKFFIQPIQEAMYHSCTYKIRENETLGSFVIKVRISKTLPSKFCPEVSQEGADLQN